jgi:hypothetical protein
MITKVATTAQYGGSGGAFYFGLSAGEWQVIGVVGGLLIALLGFAINWYYKAQHLKLARKNATEYYDK